MPKQHLKQKPWLTLGLIGCIALPAHAALGPKFTPLPDDYILRPLLENQISTQNDISQSLDELEIAYIDLNEDGIDEMMLKEKSCTGQKICTISILARAPGKLHSLGKIEGKNVAIAQSYNHGIRDLMVYDDPDNDYKYDLYVWNPQETRYKLKEDAREKTEKQE
ncbi:MAG: hypothetical protein KDI46_09125 [Alphaproteobacteria bacterium]|nr:hypothetical protein [Alphaproteobacteria bacterium]